VCLRLCWLGCHGCHECNATSLLALSALSKCPTCKRSRHRSVYSALYCSSRGGRRGRRGRGQARTGEEDRRVLKTCSSAAAVRVSNKLKQPSPAHSADRPDRSPAQSRAEQSRQPGSALRIIARACRRAVRCCHVLSCFVSCFSCFVLPVPSRPRPSRTSVSCVALVSYGVSHPQTRPQGIHARNKTGGSLFGSLPLPHVHTLSKSVLATNLARHCCLSIPRPHRSQSAVSLGLSVLSARAHSRMATVTHPRRIPREKLTHPPKIQTHPFSSQTLSDPPLLGYASSQSAMSSQRESPIPYPTNKIRTLNLEPVPYAHNESS
jgi:hypothetical protein